MNDIPDWAGKRACELLNAEADERWLKPAWCWPVDRERYVLITVAKLVMQHEQPPADPDEEAVKRVIAAYFDNEVENVLWGETIHLTRAVSQYKQEKANG